MLRGTFFRSRPPLLREGGECGLLSCQHPKPHLAERRNPYTHVPSTFQRLRDAQFGQLCLDRRGGCAIKKKAAFLAGADGVVDQAPKKIRSAERALTYLPPRRSRSKPIARVCPSCPGGEICSARLFSRSRELSVPQTPIRPDVAFLRVNPNCR